MLQLHNDKMLIKSLIFFIYTIQPATQFFCLCEFEQLHRMQKQFHSHFFPFICYYLSLSQHWDLFFHLFIFRLFNPVRISVISVFSQSLKSGSFDHSDTCSDSQQKAKMWSLSANSEHKYSTFCLADISMDCYLVKNTLHEFITSWNS